MRNVQRFHEGGRIDGEDEAERGFGRVRRYSRPISSLSRWAYYFAAFTISFDIFLVLSVGFNFRAAQLALMLPIAAATLRGFVRGHSRVPLGFPALVAWTACMWAFVPHTTFLVRNIGYAFWLTFSVLLVFATVELFDTRASVLALIRVYLYSFLSVALFGILQFSLPVVGLGSPLVTQWWIPGLIARINWQQTRHLIGATNVSHLSENTMIGP